LTILQRADGFIPLALRGLPNPAQIAVCIPPPRAEWNRALRSASMNLQLGWDMIWGMELSRLSLNFLPPIAMTWHDLAVIGGVMFLVLVWVALRLIITFRRQEVRDHVDTPTIDRRNREALESMLSLDEIAEQAANEPAPPDLIDAVEHQPKDKEVPP
jgi:hypothetical protein